MRGSVSGSAGLLAAPISIVESTRGLDEDNWTSAAPLATLSVRLSGSTVRCLWSPHCKTHAPGKSVSLHPKGVPGRYSASGRVRFAQVSLSDELLDRVAHDIRPGSRASGLLRDDLCFLGDRPLEQAVETYLHATATGASQLELESRSILIVSDLLRRYHGYAAGTSRPCGGLAGWQLRRACEEMEARLGESISLDQLAALTGISPTHFSRAFKQSTGLPPFAWLLQRRIGRAQELLADQRQSLADIALAVGFAAQPQFTTAFRRLVGVTPGAWRRAREG